MQTILGLMSGTSCDGIDIALLKTDGHTIVEFGPGMVFTYDDLFSNQLRNLFLEKDYLNILKKVYFINLIKKLN
jgi:anhydro-N-acetylmuramic acid kinase